jgi:hypothetical protein
MTNVVIALVKKTKLLVENSTKVVISVVQSSRTKLTSANYQKSLLVYTTGVFFRAIFKEYSELVGIQQLLKFLFNKNTTDQVAIYDGNNKSITSQKIDDTQITDSLSKSVSYYRIYTELEQVTDQKRLLYVKSSSDSTVISDNFVRSLQYNRAFNDITTATDDLNGAAADDQQNIYFFKNTNNLAYIADIFQTEKYYDRIYENSTSVGDLQAVHFVKNNTEYTNINDLLIRILNYNRSFIDLSNIQDTKALVFNKPLVDTTNIDDLFSKEVLYVRNIYEDITATDDLNGAAADDEQNIHFFKTKSEIANIADIFNRLNNYTRYYSDVSDISDSASYLLLKPVSDSYSTTDLVALSLVKAINDSTYITDNYSSIIQYFRSHQENTAVSDTNYLYITKNIFDTVTVLDSVLTQRNSNILDSESTGVYDTASVVVYKPFQEVPTISDFTSKNPGKGPVDTTNATSTGLLVNQSYGADYFKEDYVGVSRTIS